MAEAKLNFDESALDKTTGLYDLYSRFYEGMRTANLCDGPDYVTNPPLTESGEIDTAAIEEGLANHSTILMKNSAYMMANAIMSSVSGGGSGGGSYVGFVSRSGDSMTGALGALYGFQAGSGNKLIFETTIDSSDKQVAHIHGYLTVSEYLTVSGQFNVGNDGIFFSNQQSIFYKDDVLNIASQDIKMTGKVAVDGDLSVGAISIGTNGIFNGTNEYYHAGNSNNSTTDWDMRNAHVYGDLTVDGAQNYNGRLTALKGFDLGEDDKKLLYSYKENEESAAYIQLATDLALWSGYGIKFDNTYIIKVRGGSDNIVSFAAPGKIMNLGDSDGETKTVHIALQTAIKNYNGDYSIVTQYGDGNFPNSFSAGCANSGPTVLQTYYTNANDCGIISKRNLRLGTASGPIINTGNLNDDVVFDLPYVHVLVEGLPQTERIPFNLRYMATTSLFRDQSKEWSASLNFDTDAEFFTFNKHVESASFSIISEKYKTRLIENTLFFDDGVFIEGVTDGLRFTGNAYYVNNVSSMRFASGFAGYGWAIAQDELVGGYSATFDELTIRKKARFYELEVQKHSVTNGALWVSDSCSGDLVEEIV